MRVYRKAWIVAAVVLALLLPTGHAGFGLAAGAPAETGTGEFSNLAIDRERTVSQEFQPVLSNSAYALSYKDDTAEIAVKDLKSGRVWYSNPQDRAADSLAAGDRQNALSSQFELMFFRDASTAETMDSHSFSTELVQHAYTVEDDRLLVTYQLGKNEFSIDWLPRAMSKKRMEALLAKLSSEEAEEVEERYEYYDLKETDETLRPQLIQDFPLVKTTPIYVRQEFPDYLGEELYVLFQQAGYTREDLLADCKENAIDINIPESVSITLTVVYSLNADGFSATIPAESLVYSKTTPVTEISLLPYFGCGGGAEQGFMLVPDGSGALIRFNNGKVAADSYRQKLFGRDPALFQQNLDHPSEQALLPVFGVGKGEAGWLGVIDGGIEIASVAADVAGKTNSYNHVYSLFKVNAFDQVSMGGETATENTMYRFSARHNPSDIQVSYLFTGGTYADMANAYRIRLEHAGVLTDRVGGEVPLNLELTGAVTEKKSFLGVRYEALSATTTFADAADLVKQLGVPTDVKMVNALTGGDAQARADRAKPLSLLGGKKGLAALQALCGNVYLDVAIQHADRLPKAMSARQLSKDVVKVYAYDPISKYFRYNGRFDKLISPAYFERMAPAMTKRLKGSGVTALNINDIGWQIGTDFNQKREISPAEAMTETQKLLKTLAADFSLSAEQGGLYTLGVAGKLWNMPGDSSRFALEDEAVPFYQMVAHGYVDYCLSPVNDSTDPRLALLKSIEYGAGLQYSLVSRPVKKPVATENRFYNKDYRNHLEEIKAFYGESAALLSRVQGLCMVGHEQLKDGAAVTYEDGTVVVVNYADAELLYGGKTVGARSALVLP